MRPSTGAWPGAIRTPSVAALNLVALNLAAVNFAALCLLGCGVPASAELESREAIKSLTNETFTSALPADQEAVPQSALRSHHYFYNTGNGANPPLFTTIENAYAAVLQVFRENADNYIDTKFPSGKRQRLYAEAENIAIKRNDSGTAVSIGWLEGRQLKVPNTDAADNTEAAPDRVLTRHLGQHIANAASTLPREWFIEDGAQCRNQSQSFTVKAGVNLFLISGPGIDLSQGAHQDGSDGAVIAVVVPIEGCAFPSHFMEIHTFSSVTPRSLPSKPQLLIKRPSPQGMALLGVDDRKLRKPSPNNRMPVAYAHAASRTQGDIAKAKSNNVNECAGVIVLTFKPVLDTQGQTR